MEKIKIDNYENLLEFANRDDVSAAAIVEVFERGFGGVAIVLTDAVTGEPCLNKENVVDTIKGFINDIRQGNEPNKVVLFN